MPTLNNRDLALDPHLRERGFLVELNHPEVGRRTHAGIPWTMSGTPCTVRSPAPMFGGDKAAAQTNICVLFVGTDGHAVGLGAIQQALEITAAIETNGGSTACLSGSSTSDHGSQNGGQPSFTAPTSSTATTMGLVKQVFAAVQHGTALGKLAQDCGATPVTGSPGSGSGDHGQPTGTPGGKPTGTPGARPTGTPGRP